ncbi:unknown [Clostridium sp. CAG:1024]|nr:unknown [Clostridium sp. CAG:1024]
MPRAGDIGRKASDQHGDAGMPARKQVIDDLVNAIGIVGGDAGEIEALRPGVDENDSDVLTLKLGDQRGIGVSRQNDPVDLLALGRMRPLLCGRDQQMIGCAVDPAHHALADAGVEGVQNRRPLLADEESDLVRLLPSHRAGNGAGAVMQFLRCGIDPGAGGLLYPLRRGECSGDRGCGNAGKPGYIIYGWLVHRATLPV